MEPVPGGIADDITGATDLALMLGRHGMPVAQLIGCPAADDHLEAGAALYQRTGDLIPCELGGTAGTTQICEAIRTALSG